MAGVPITFSQAALLKGPAHLFVDVAVPAAGSKMTLTSDTGSGWKTPDATENPNALYAGCLKDLKVSGSQEQSDEFCDNLSSPILTIPGQTKYTIEVMLHSILSETLMAKLFNTTTQTISGSTKIQFGSVENFPSMAIAIVGRMVNDSTKYCYLLFYSCRQVNVMAPDQFKINALSKVPVKFQALSLSGRVAGADVGEYVHTI